MYVHVFTKYQKTYVALQINQVLYMIIYEMSIAVITDVSAYETNIYKK